MKKVITAVLIAAVLILPLSAAALTSQEEAPVQSAAESFLPGSVPAELSPADSMGPALHGVLLAMLNHDVSAFGPADAGLAWESLYNMLSLYGQLDSRSETLEDDLLLPSETVQDYAAALDLLLAEMSPLPAALTDRITYNRTQDAYRVVCGSDGLAQLQVQQTRTSGGVLQLTGALIYEVDGQELARFQAELQPRDNMFGYAVTALVLN